MPLALPSQGESSATASSRLAYPWSLPASCSPRGRCVPPDGLSAPPRLDASQKGEAMADLFPAHTPETAPEEARPALTATQKQLGFIPTMMAKFAEAPLLLQAYQTASA